MALDQFVNAVQTLSSQANYAELCDHLNKSVEVLSRNPGQLDNILESLDMSQHSLGYLAVLVARIGHVGAEETEVWAEMISKCDRFVSVCNNDQIRSVPQHHTDSAVLLQGLRVPSACYIGLQLSIKIYLYHVLSSSDL